MAAASSRPRVVVVGSANYDLFVYMARFPAPGETVHGHTASACCGGKGSNQCVMSARLGAPTAMVACVGKDVFAATIRAAWDAEQVDTSHVREAADGVATGQAQIWVSDDGTNSIVVISGANADLTPEDVRAAEPLIRGAAVVVCQLEVPRATTLEALRLAHKHGVESILNPAPAAGDLEPELLALPSVICPNETELSLLTGGLPVQTDADVKAAARKLLSQAGENASVLVTLGAMGAMLLDRKEHAEGTWIRCPVVDKPMDTSGAGDCFLGALAAYRSVGVPWEAAVRKAGHVATMSVQRAGTQTSYPTIAELPEELRLHNA